MKKNILLHKILAVFCDLIIAGVLLCTFALFHHVIPQKGNTENAISIPKPTASIPAFSLPDINTPQYILPQSAQQLQAVRQIQSAQRQRLPLLFRIPQKKRLT